jgi:acetyltransferase
MEKINLSKSANPNESVHNFLNKKGSAIDAFFFPKTVAVIGATETPGSVGRTVLSNLIATPFGGTVYPVNPKRANVLGIKAYARVGEIHELLDLAVIMTPAPTVPGLIRECVEAGVRAVIVISAGFKEIGPAGAELEKQVLAEAKRGGIRIIGPNCLGLMNPLNGLNATFAASMARPGNVGFISQSGALLTAILDWSLQELVGFSAFVSVGSMLDVGWGDLIDYLGDDPNTKSILIYMESIGDARSFLSAAREVALNKPIIVIKAGRTAGAAKAAASHTGSLAGSDDVLDAAFRRCGVLRVDRISDLFYMAEVLGKQPRPMGPRLTVITNAGGPGVLATDALLQTGGQLAAISKETSSALDTFLPAAWSHNNPIDVLGDAGPERYAKTLDVAGRDPASDGLLVILTPQAMTDATKTAEALKPFAQMGDKPVIASWMGGAHVRSGADILRNSQIPIFGYPDTAVRMFTYMWQYQQTLEGLYETPLPAVIENHAEAKAEAHALIEGVLKAGRTLLPEMESKALLRLYGIPVTETVIAKDEAEAVKRADKLGYPVVLKLYSESITHKTDVGGVRLNIRHAAGVREAFRSIQKSVRQKAGSKAFDGVTVQPMVHLRDSYEVILGSSPDAQFGPVILFGSGGQLVEIYKDKALGLPPLNTTLARRLMERTKIFNAFRGVRGRKPIDVKALDQIVVRFGQLISDHKRLKEIDINPLLVSPEGIIALDARVVLHDPKLKDSELPTQAIRPYPARYASAFKLKDGKRVMIRPIRHQDEPLMVKFHQTLSDRSVYLRYFEAFQLDKRVQHERLARRCFIDYDREMALIAEGKNAKTGERELLGIARFVKLRGTSDAEFSILISDETQRKGLGVELMRRLITVAKDEHVRQLRADVLPDNEGMCHLLKRLHFDLVVDPSSPILHATRVP